MATESLHNQWNRNFIIVCKILVVFFIIIQNPFRTAGQGNCSTALPAATDSSITGYLGDSVIWYRFIADTSSYCISINVTGYAPKAMISDIILYNGTCSSGIQIGQSSINDSLNINTDTLHAGNTYYIKIIRQSGNNGYFVLSIFKDNGGTWPPDACLPGLCNIISNGDFEVTNPLFNTNFYIKVPFYFNLVCAWHPAQGSAQIVFENGNLHATMWSFISNYSPNNYGEAISTHARMNAGTDYSVEFSYRVHGHSPDSVIVGQSNYDTCMGTNVGAGTLFISDSVICRTIFSVYRPPADNVWKRVRLIYRPTVTSELVYFFPYSTVNRNQAYMDLDSINIHAVPKVNAGNDLFYCGQDTVTLGNTATGGIPPYYYNWYPSYGLNNRHIATPDANPSTTTTYFVRVSDSIGCKASDSVKVSVFPPLLLDAGSDRIICPGNTAIIGGLASGTSPFLNYSWNPVTGLINSTSPVTTANPSSTITYWETAIDGNGCMAKDSVTVHVTNIGFSAGRDTTLCLSSSTLIGNTASGGMAPYTYKWSPATGLSSTTIAQPIATPTATTTYTCTVTDQSGCMVVDNNLVNIVSPPVLAGITGPNNNCKSNKKTYTVINQNSSYNYTWHIIPQWAGVITAFQGTNKYGCTINWSNIPTSSPPYAIVRVTAGYVNGGCYCETSKEMKVFNCCVNNNIASIALSDTVIAANLVRGRTYMINGTLIINGNISAKRNGFCMGPEARIVVNPSKTFTIDTSAFTGFCNYMWDGIYLTDSTSKVIMRKDTLKDAYNALVSEKGGKYDITSTVFDKNLKDIIIRNYPSKVNPGMIRSSKFLCSSNLIFPFTGISRKRVAVDIYDAGRIVIGDSLGFSKRNIFINADTCIKAVYSHIRVHNNSFSNPSPVNNSVGIHTYGYSFIRPSTTVVGNTNTSSMKRSNYINNFDYGVRALNYQNLYVINDSITAGSTIASHQYGVTVLNCAGTKVYVKNNYINRQRIGVYAYEQYLSRIRIMNNNIVNMMAVGIQVQDAFSTAIDTMIISGNTVRSYPQLYYPAIYGIITGNILPGADYPRIESNKVYIESYSPNYPLTYGIRLFNCKNTRVTSNIVRQTGSLLNIPDTVKAKQLNGITAEYSRRTDIGCNKVSRMGSAFLLRYDCDTSRLLRNTIDTFFYGVRFDTARIANQGNSTTVYDNTWQPHYYSISLYKRTKGTFISYLSTLNWYYRNPSRSVYDPTPKHITLGNLYNYGITNPANCPQCNTFLPKSMASTTQMSSEISSLSGSEDLMQAPESYGSQVSAADDYFKLADVYRSLRENLRLAASSSSLLNLYNNLSNGNVGKYVRFSDLISQRNFTEASAQNDAFTPLNQVEYHIKTVNDIYLDTWAAGRYDFTSDEYSALIGIAEQSPYMGGPAVYTARVMLGYDINYMDQRSTEVPGQNDSGAFDAPVFGKPYPNPASDRLNLDYHLPEHTEAEFLIYNLNGQLLGSYKLESASGKMSITTDHFQDGLYIYQISLSNYVSDRGKFIILKCR